ncbi:MAG: flagellar biosynthetic protein FliQ [Deltaproteobacteria bacterium]|nr:flagellar biosynthetic protein FliQ [Deltaproteobacteria bacterium]
MDIEDFIRISSFGIQTAIVVSAPVLLLGLVAGVSISIVQAATQINDSALAFIPKILATVAALFFFGSWMISKMAYFATFALNQIPQVTT